MVPKALAIKMPYLNVCNHKDKDQLGRIPEISTNSLKSEILFMGYQKCMVSFSKENKMFLWWYALENGVQASLKEMYFTLC